MKNPVILVLQRGWVVVGDFSQKKTQITLTNASVIRIWGTKTGLGELRNGPLKSTVLDPIGEITVHELTVVMQVKCTNWS